ncbi:MAG: hypothetical protein ABI780_03725 [Ardenticatenales bacterium]
MIPALTRSAAIALAVLAAVALPRALPRPAGTPRIAAHARAVGGGPTAPPTLTVHLGTALAILSHADNGPYTRTAELHGPAGLIARDTADAYYGSGPYHFAFRAGPTGRPLDLAAPDRPLIAPGDRIVVRDGNAAPAAAPVVTVTVPLLTGDIEPSTGDLAGRAAPGATVIVSVRRGAFDPVQRWWPMDRDLFWSEVLSPPSWRSAATAGADGRWRVPAARFGGPLASGDRADVSTVDVAGHRFEVGLAPLAVAVSRMEDRVAVLVQATNGRRLRTVVTSPWGSTESAERFASVWGWDWDIDQTHAGEGGRGSSLFLLGWLNNPKLPTLPAGPGLPAGTRIDVFAASGSGESGGSPAAEPLASLTTGTPALERRYGAGFTGRAGSARRVRLRAGGPLGMQLEAATGVAASGAYTLSMAPFDAGWSTVVAEEAGGLAAVWLPEARFVRAMPGSPVVTGRALAADERVTVTLRDGSGREVASGVGYPSLQEGNAWSAVLRRPPPGGEGAPMIAQPGQSIEVAFDEGDPVAVAVAALSATSDVAGGELHGTAPPGARLVVHGTDGIRPPWALAYEPGQRVSVSAVVTADLTGRWTLPVPGLGRADVGTEPERGLVTLAGSGGTAVSTVWAPMAVDLDLDGSTVRGVGPPWLPTDVTVLDADGALVATVRDDASQRVLWGGDINDDPWWSADVRDGAGAPIGLRTGDTVTARSGGEAVALVVPPLEGVVHAADDVVAGRAAPGADVQVEVRGVVGATPIRTRLVHADALGRWSIDLRAEGLDIGIDTTALVVAHIGRHTVRRYLAAPGLTLDLNTGLVRGRTMPLGPLTVTLAARAADASGAARTLIADPAGDFAAPLPGPGGSAAGRRSPPPVGSQVRVSVPDFRGGVVTTAVDVPSLAVIVDGAADRVTLLTAPGALARLAVADAVARRPGGWDEAPRAVGTDGRLDFDLRGAVDLVPGSVVVATITLPSGHRVQLWRQVPRFVALLGSPDVCASGEPGARVAAELVRGGGVLASAVDTLPDAGSASLVLLAADGRSVPLRSGDVVRVQHGGAVPIASSLPMPQLSWAMDWSSSRLVGRTDPGQAVRARFAGVPGCTIFAPGTLDAATAYDWDIAQPVNVAPDGSFAWDHGGDVTFGLMDLADLTLDLELPNADGHAVAARGRALRADAYVDTPRIAGEADAGVDVGVDLASADGTPRGTLLARTDSSGRFDGIVTGPDGRAILLRPGDRVTLRAGPQAVSFEVALLGMDRASNGDLAGTAAPGATVLLFTTLDEAHGWPQNIRAQQATADERGRWTLVAAAGHRGWSLDDALAVAAAVAGGGRNRTAALWRRAADEAPRTPGWAYLPWLARRVR